MNSRTKDRDVVKQVLADETKAVALASGGALVAGPIDFADDAGKGIEGADKDSYAIPFLIILQPQSPAVLEGNLPEAKPGALMNSVTMDLYKEAVFVPCAFQRRWIRWQSRNNGGGFKGEFSTAQALELKAKGEVRDLDGRLYYPLPDGSVNPEKSDRLSDTRSHFGLLLRTPDDDFGMPVVFALASTGITVSKRLMSRIEGIRLRKPNGEAFNPPSFSHMYSVKTLKETNEKGTWFLPVIDIVGQVKHPAVYAQAKAFYTQVSAGQVQVAHDSVKGQGGVDDGAESAGRASAGATDKGF